MAAVRSPAWLRRNFPMSVPRNRLPFALLVLVTIGAGFALLAAQFAALGEVHAARAVHSSGLAASASSAQAASPVLTTLAATAAQRGSDNPILAKSYRFERGGWIYVHLEGTPHDIGYQ